jgi:aminoglycoside phosphotransferase
MASRWEQFGFAGGRPERFLYTLSAERHWHSKAVLYCFPHDRRKQAVIVKIQKDDLHLGLLENEYLHLKALHNDVGLGELRESIPRPLFFGQVADHPLLIETYMPGVPFSKHAQRREPESFLRVAEWLRAFHTRTVGGARTLTAPDISVYFLRPLEAAMQAINGHRSIRLFLDHFRRRLEALPGTELPLVFSHNDLCLNNVRFDGERIRVIDWEFSRHPDLPLSDLVNAFLFFAMTWRKLSYTEAFRLTFFGDNGLSLLFRRCLSGYAKDLGLSPGMLHLLLVQYLISRIHLLKSVGNVANLADILGCLCTLAEGRVAPKPWTDPQPGASRAAEP